MRLTERQWWLQKALQGKDGKPSFGERHEALAAEHHMGMLEAREGEPEMIEPMRQSFARNGDAERRHVGEVG
jgi:hypothetical protein